MDATQVVQTPTQVGIRARWVVALVAAACLVALVAVFFGLLLVGRASSHKPAVWHGSPVVNLNKPVGVVVKASLGPAAGLPELKVTPKPASVYHPPAPVYRPPVVPTPTQTTAPTVTVSPPAPTHTTTVPAVTKPKPKPKPTAVIVHG